MDDEVSKKARLLYGLQRYGDVVELLETNPQCLDTGYGCSLYCAALLGLKRLHDTLAAAERGLKKHPYYYPLFFYKAEVYKQFGVYSKALDAAQAALVCDPEDAFYHAVVASIYLADDKVAKARKHAETALKLDPEDTYARIILASVSSFFDDDAKARAYIHEALALEPDNAAALAALAALSEKRSEKVVLLKRALRHEPTEEKYQKEYRQYTRTRRYDYGAGVVLTLLGMGVGYFLPGEQFHLLEKTFFVVAPLLFLYLSKHFWLTTLVVFCWFGYLALMAGDLFQSPWQGQALIHNGIYVAILAALALFGTFVLSCLHVMLVGLFEILRHRWQQYNKAGKGQAGGQLLWELVCAKRTYYYLVSGFIIPLANVIVHMRHPALFWPVFVSSFFLFGLTLTVLGGVRRVWAVVSSVLTYGFLGVLMTLLAGGVLENTMITVGAVFVAACVASYVAYLNGIGKSQKAG